MKRWRLFDRVRRALHRDARSHTPHLQLNRNRYRNRRGDLYLLMRRCETGIAHRKRICIERQVIEVVVAARIRYRLTRIPADRIRNHHARPGTSAPPGSVTVPLHCPMYSGQTPHPPQGPSRIPPPSRRIGDSRKLAASSKLLLVSTTGTEALCGCGEFRSAPRTRDAELHWEDRLGLNPVLALNPTRRSSNYTLLQGLERRRPAEHRKVPLRLGCMMQRLHPLAFHQHQPHCATCDDTGSAECIATHSGQCSSPPGPCDPTGTDPAWVACSGSHWP